MSKIQNSKLLRLWFRSFEFWICLVPRFAGFDIRISNFFSGYASSWPFSTLTSYHNPINFTSSGQRFKAPRNRRLFLSLEERTSPTNICQSAIVRTEHYAMKGRNVPPNAESGAPALKARLDIHPAVRDGQAGPPVSPERAEQIIQQREAAGRQNALSILAAMEVRHRKERGG
jgi:hypothetical protein